MPLCSIVKEPLNLSPPPDPGGQAHFIRPAERNNGADRDRTGDLRLAKPALSQLSYSPLGYPAGPLAVRCHRSARRALGNEGGGPKWTRTTDLTLIRRAL
jgi:hypothetical protein